MIADTYVILRWADGALSITGWGYAMALVLVVMFALWRGSVR